MSRLGKKPIDVSNVEVSLDKQTVTIKGPKGQLSTLLSDTISVSLQDKELQLKSDLTKKDNRSKLGLYRALINNNVIGVTKGYEKQLVLVGLGYRAAIKGENLEILLGYSHPCICPAIDGIKYSVEKQTTITISGINKQQVGEAAALIIKLRPPNPYKGKGVRYKGQKISLKAGKTIKK